jgi:hypothetical protein
MGRQSQDLTHQSGWEVTGVCGSGNLAGAKGTHGVIEAESSPHCLPLDPGLQVFCPKSFPADRRT